MLSRTDLQAQVPLAIAGKRVFNYARTGVNSSERPIRTAYIRTSLHLRARERKGPASGPSRSSRTNPVRVSGTPRMRTTSEPASHRCMLGATQFQAMNWPLEQLGSEAIIFPGVGTRDHARTAIQTLSGTVPTRHVYTHTGWRQIDGQCHQPDPSPTDTVARGIPKTNRARRGRTRSSLSGCRGNSRH